jgi:hypothetical protein
MLKIEFDKPKQSACACCEGTTTRLTRFVYKDDSAYAVYYACFSDNHPERLFDLVVSLGEWGEGTSPEQRRAFSMRIRAGETQYQVMVTNADECPWRNARVIGRVLDREEALADPWVKDAFHITDHIVVEDKLLKEYLDGPVA